MFIQRSCPTCLTLLCINPHKAVKPSSYVTLKGPSNAALQPEMESNLYVQALHDNNDYHFCKDPVNKGKPTELLWSLLSMDVIMPYIPPIQTLTCPCVLHGYMTVWTYIKIPTSEF